MGRTLYLNGSRGKGLAVLRDGPSVLIASREKACRRVPVRLIGRVVIMGNVRVDARAITLFTGNDVPVVFLSRTAEEVAVAIPYNHRLPAHYEQQKVFLESQHNTGRFKEWADTKRMVIQSNVLKRMFRSLAGILRYGVGEGNYQELLSGMKPSDEEQWETVTNVVHNLLRGLIIEHLMKAGLDPHLGVVHRRHNFGLALDICHIMGAESDVQCLQFFRRAGDRPYIEKKGRRWVVTDAGMLNIVQRFENRRRTLDSLVAQIIDEIFELMRELNTSKIWLEKPGA